MRNGEVEVYADLSPIHPCSGTAIGQEERFRGFTGKVVAREGPGIP